MKKILCLILTLSFIFSLNSFNLVFAESTAIGSSEANPIIIKSLASFYEATENKYYRLEANLNVSSSIEFIGKLDGNGYTITSNSNAPIFSSNTGNIKNLKAVTTNTYSTAGMVTSNSGIIEECYTEVSVSLNKSRSASTISGIAAYNKGTIKNCRSSISGEIVQASASHFITGIYLGGIAYDNTDGIIENCYTNIDISNMEFASTTINGSNMTLNYGGIAFKGGNVTNSYAENNIFYSYKGSGSFSANLFGISPDDTVTDSYYTSPSDYTFSGGNKVSSMENLKPSKWDFETVWALEDGFNNNKPYLLPSELKVSSEKTKVFAANQTQLNIAYTISSMLNEKHLTYKSSDTAVAAVDENGIVTALSEGMAKITVSYLSISSEVEITVPAVISSIKLTEYEKDLYIGKTYTISPEYSPKEAETGNVTYTSSDTSILTVTSKGVVTPLKKGTASVTLQAENGNKTATITINVIQPTTSIELDKNSLITKIDEKYSITASVKPTDADNMKVRWTSDNDCISISSSGDNNEILEITTLSSGTAVITASTEDTALTAVCTVTVLSEIDGSGTSDDPYIITSAEQLNDVRQRLDAYFVLKNDIDLTNMDFKPIGDKDSPFTGHIDGENHIIKNYKLVSYQNTYLGLIGYNSGTIKNLNAENFNLSGNSVYGGLLCGYNTGTIENCKADGTVKLNSSSQTLYAGGIAGYSINTLSLCEALSDTLIYTATSKGDAYAGGIAGYGTDIYECTSKGTVITSGSRYEYAGGIAGSSKKITNCVNYASVSANSAPKYSYAGGITGEASFISDCTNEGNVSSIVYAGGISASIPSDTSYINDCTNKGSVSEAYVSGGISAISSGSIKKCGNYASVSAKETSGGICGALTSSAKILNCKNIGSVISDSSENSSETAITSTGGIVGYNSGIIAASFNVGSVKAYTNNAKAHTYTYTGGVAGYSDYTSTSSDSSLGISDCYNHASVSAPGNTGGIVGYLTNSTISRCYNIGTVTCSSSICEKFGGIIGTQINSNGSNCYYLKTSAAKGIGSQTDSTITVSSKSKSDMKREISYVGFLFGDTWAIAPNINNGYPYLCEVSPEIGSSEDTTESTTENSTEGSTEGTTENSTEGSTEAPSKKDIYTVTGLSFTTTKGMVIQKPKNGSFLAEVSVTKNITSADTGKDYIIIAATDENGSLISLNYMLADIKIGSAAFAALIDIPFEKTLGTVKAFVWDNLDSIETLSNVVEK